MSTLIIQKVNVTISFRVPGFLKIICDLSYNFVLMLYASQQVIFFFLIGIRKTYVENFHLTFFFCLQDICTEIQ